MPGKRERISKRGAGAAPAAARPQRLVITIDGPAGAGKSTAAGKLAGLLNIFYLDTGAMYRALTLKALRGGVALEDERRLAALARKTKIDFKLGGGGEARILLDGRDVSRQIRSQEVTDSTFYIARAPQVRAAMVRRQRDIAARHSVVAEGRDTGTVVFPDAPYKFYLDADFEERSQRRLRELREKGEAVREEALKMALKERDRRDSTRRVGPLKVAADAVVIDSTHLTADEVVAKMLQCLRMPRGHSLKPHG